MMRWEDERYVRLYTRDTATWLKLSWQARFVLMTLLRKVDRAGVLELDDDDDLLESLALVIQVPLEVVDVGLPDLLKRGTAVRNGSTLVLPKFIEAQETRTSDAARQRKAREKARDTARTSEADRKGIPTEHGESVTRRHEASHAVTSHSVTDGHSEPCLAVPSQPNLPPVPPNGRGRADDTTPEAQSQEPAEPVQPPTESPFDVALRIYSEQFAKRHRRPFMLTSFGSASSDESALMRVGRLAEAKGDTERWVRHWMRAFLRDDEKWLVDNAHPPRQLERRLNKYGEPKKPRPAVPKQEPPPEPSHTFTKLEPVVQPAPLRKVASTPEELAEKARTDRARLAAQEMAWRNHS